MNNSYKALVKQYKIRQIMKLFAALVVNVVMFSIVSVLSAQGVIAFMAGLTAFIAFFYFIIESVKSLGMLYVRAKGNKALKNKGLWDDAVTAMENAMYIQVDKQRFAMTDKYLCLPYGMILELNRIAWVYMQIQRIGYFYIPIMKMSICQFRLLDETSAVGFYGKVRDMEAFKKLLLGLKLHIPELLIGYSGENQKMYQKMVAEHKKA